MFQFVVRRPQNVPKLQLYKLLTKVVDETWSIQKH